ncbi:MAG: hypothetical protein VXX02_07060 [Pseudomonadota bacterium]|nr:hypothetical protein [Pseudomonadota bacterium]
MSEQGLWLLLAPHHGSKRSSSMPLSGICRLALLYIEQADPTATGILSDTWCAGLYVSGHDNSILPETVRFNGVFIGLAGS